MSLPLLRLLCCALCIATTGSAATPAARFASPLPDPLTATDGTRIQSREQWAKRRAEIAQLFASEVYGRAAVGRPAQLGFDVTEKDARAFDGTARRRLVDIKYAGPGGEGTIALRLYLPPAGVKPKGCFVLIVNRDRAIITDAEANPMEFWPAKGIVARGYIAAAFHNSDVASDVKTDSWSATADPSAEFGACVAAESAFRLFGGSGVGVTTHPAVDTPVHQGSVGYHMRGGMHDLKVWDWQQFMTYTNRHWKTFEP